MLGKNKGFTLIEMLVVIVIIGLLAGIALISVNNAREKAKQAKSDADIAQILRAVEKARFENDAVLGAVTGSYCSACSCWDVSCDYQCAACKTTMDATMQALGFRGALVDPWGKYYSFDENENEGGSCNNRDTLRYSIKGVNYGMYIPYYTTYCRESGP